MRTTTLLIGCVLVAGCGDSSTGAEAAGLCATSQGLEVCADRTEYRPADEVSASLANSTAAPMYIGGCSIKVVGKTSREAEFETTYSPAARCGSDVDADEILANLVEIPAGETLVLPVPISSIAFQGYYRVNVWILDAAGQRVSSLPAFSGTFEVFPSAGS
ncbi:MAG: hypothetical protein R3195_18270 [Gemmatimonadota bacterium]|nr:hypothetical protein [Gemmatimonadota bacterium]